MLSTSSIVYLPYSCFLLILFLANFSTAKSGAGWLRVCGKKEHYKIQSDVCHKGIFLEKPLHLRCVCVKGAWILSKGPCDIRWLLLVGNGHCFHIDDKVRSLKFIGNPDNAFASASYTGPPSLNNFTDIAGGDFTSPISTYKSVVVAVDPKYNIETKDKSICLSKGNGLKAVYLYFNRDSSTDQWRTNYNRECSSSPEDYHHRVGVGEMYRNSIVIPHETAEGVCSSACFKGKTENQNNVNPFEDPANSNEENVRQGRAAKGLKAETSASMQKVSDCLPEILEVTQDPAQYERETKEQTIRMMAAFMKPVLFNVSAFSVRTNEYEYFKKAQQIFLKACPAGESSKFVANAIFRMWGWLVSESQDQFSHSDNPNEEEHKKMIGLLDKCIDLDLLIRENKTYNSDTSCVQDVISGTGTRYNGNETEIFDKMPEHLKFDNTKFDIVVETAWKLAVILYYRCAAVFSENGTPMELSYLMDKLQSFFNGKIVKRWNDSKDSWSVYMLALFNYDVPSFVGTLDRCVAFSKELSEIPNWILRPKIPCTDNDLSRARPKRSTSTRKTSPKVWGGKGVCLKQFLDPAATFGYKMDYDC